MALFPCVDIHRGAHSVFCLTYCLLCVRFEHEDAPLTSMGPSFFTRDPFWSHGAPFETESRSLSQYQRRYSSIARKIGLVTRAGLSFHRESRQNASASCCDVIFMVREVPPAIRGKEAITARVKHWPTIPRYKNLQANAHNARRAPTMKKKTRRATTRRKSRECVRHANTQTSCHVEGGVDGRELEVVEGLGAERDEHGDEPGRHAHDEGHGPPLRRSPLVGRPPSARDGIYYAKEMSHA